MPKKTIFVMVLDDDDETNITKAKEDLTLLGQNYNGNLYLDSMDEGYGLLKTETNNDVEGGLDFSPNKRGH